MFYEFIQNNSGGSFNLDKEAGITHVVIIEADNVQDALRNAEFVGIYFDGCDDGIDCPCCGDRWSDWIEGKDVPSHYNTALVSADVIGFKWMEKGYEACIHYKDGQKVWL